ncbi:unnamed protein product [Lupinus luteus]|uniref:Response regulatory domain-containing protein n=1 Tax=Lupinus luteus TaxID=3873 RepID=A0AAV1X1D3_LUPLU
MEMEVVDTAKLQEEHFHVLVVDDSVIDRKLLERLLRDSSCKVTFLESGDKALKYLGLHNASSTSSDHGMKVNLIMTDYCMPGMSGYDLLKRIKLQESTLRDIPVVIMSSENTPSRISMCLEEGAEEFLLKPLQLSDLKRLQPYFMKSFDNTSIASNNDNIINNNGISKMKVIPVEHCFKLWYVIVVVIAILQFWESL